MSRAQAASSTARRPKKKKPFDCAICFETMRDRFPWAICSCSHMFHKRCMDMWAQTCRGNGRQITCPLCKRPCAKYRTRTAPPKVKKIPKGVVCVDLTDAKPAKEAQSSGSQMVTVIDLVQDPSGETMTRHSVAGDPKLMRTCNHSHLTRTVQQNSDGSIDCVFCHKTMGTIMRRCRTCGAIGHKVCFERKRKPPVHDLPGGGGKGRGRGRGSKGRGRGSKGRGSGKSKVVKRNSVQTRSKTAARRRAAERGGTKKKR